MVPDNHAVSQRLQQLLTLLPLVCTVQSISMVCHAVGLSPACAQQVTSGNDHCFQQCQSNQSDHIVMITESEPG